MRKIEIIISAIIALNSFLIPQNSVNFDKFFINKTMRIDYYHIGNAQEEFITLDRIYTQGMWAGSTKKLIDKFNNGRYYVKVYDYSTNQLIFSRGYDSYFGEYKTTEPAIKGIKKTCHETILMPYPKGKIIVAIEKRDRKNTLHQIFKEVIDPNDINIIREVPLSKVKILEFLKNGHPHSKVDILFVAEGYTQEEEEKFAFDVKRLLKIFFKQEPYKSLRNKFNIFGVYVPSEESGCDEPTYGSFKNTVLNSSFNSFSSQRYLLTEDNKSLRDIAGCVPYDTIIILVNTKRYGGGGIYNLYCTVVSDNYWTDYLLIHEFGHLFAGLADEYYTSFVAYNEFYPRGVEPLEPNITALLSSKNLKWASFLSPGIEVPTPWEKKEFEKMDKEYQKIRRELNKRIALLKRKKASRTEIEKLEEESEKLSREHSKKINAFLKKSKYYGKVGVFEGAGYSAKGLFRPMVDCIMFSKGFKPYCVICQEAIRKVIFYYSD